jgi:hypothetical protein
MVTLAHLLIEAPDKANQRHLEGGSGLSRGKRVAPKPECTFKKGVIRAAPENYRAEQITRQSP